MSPAAADTRERPKKASLRAVTRFPKNRTRSGCFTCRKRKKKCNEHSPVCSGCARNFLQCVWPSTPTETLPKAFQIAPSTSCGSENQELLNDACPTPHQEQPEMVVQTSKKKQIETVIECPADPESTFDDGLTNVPAKLCSIIQLNKYSHKIPFPLKTTIPDSIDTVMDLKYTHTSYLYPSAHSNDISITTLEDTYVDPHTISQMFNSLYSEQHDASSASSGSPTDSSIYSDLLNYVPKTQLPQVSVKNPTLASLREIFYARGCSFLAKNSDNNAKEVSQKYAAAAQRHYHTACKIMEDNTAYVKGSGVEDHPAWQVFAMPQLCDADKYMGLVSEPCISALLAAGSHISISESALAVGGMKESEGKNFDKALFSELLFVYPFLIYFSPSLENVISPEKLFDTYNRDMVDVFLTDNGTWLDNVLTTAIINTLQTLTKLTYLLRVRSSLDSKQLSERLKQLKLDISLIWTTIQTSEIQAETNSPIAMIEFAKLVHMAVEVLYLTISDPSVQASSPIIGFYLDQFMLCYDAFSKATLSSSNHVGETTFTSKCFTLLPLFVMSCASKTLAQREYLSKELYLLSRDLGLEFFEQLMLKIEDAWCEEEAGGTKTLQRFTSRDGFAELVYI